MKKSHKPTTIRWGNHMKSMSSHLRRIAGAGLAACALFASVAVAPPARANNLLPNPGFEESVLEPAPVLQYRAVQPVLPTGWAFEGAAGLFDHSPNVAASGRRSAAISIPLSGNNYVCGPSIGCIYSPTGDVKNIAQQGYSVAPAWRNAVPVPVNGGQGYTLAASVRCDFVTDREGAFLKVRWYNFAMVPIGVSTADEFRTNEGCNSGFQGAGGGVQAPGDAAYAVVLLGHTDDVWLGQVAFDDVFFG